MLPLIQFDIRIRIIYQGIEKIKCIPDGHFLFIKLQEFFAFALYKFIRLVSMIETVKFLYGFPLGVLVISEFLLSFCRDMGFRVSGQNIVFPLIQRFEWSDFGRTKLMIFHNDEFGLSKVNKFLSVTGLIFNVFV